MQPLRSVCVYCGSGHGIDPEYKESAKILGRHMAHAGIRLVYGGGSIGLMGTVAKSVLKHGGEVTGIIPKFLEEREVMLRDVQELIVTDDMHERKRLMFDKAEAFVALPGGIGTLEETVEMLTWAQLGQHKKPVLLANIDQFWDPLIQLLNHMRREEFIRPDSDIQFLEAKKAEDIIPILTGEASHLDRTDLELGADVEPIRRL
ncbi:TIGR00730 family Rossman fold protein [Coralliovum pocilloporae]|uniref:LOG family protein n=1 Tax=Coralliovum pocilloporae TaxID=3066369 RepID=UPI00330732E8